MAGLTECLSVVCSFQGTFASAYFQCNISFRSRLTLTSYLATIDVCLGRLPSPPGCVLLLAKHTRFFGIIVKFCLETLSLYIMFMGVGEISSELFRLNIPAEYMRYFHLLRTYHCKCFEFVVILSPKRMCSAITCKLI